MAGGARGSLPVTIRAAGEDRLPAASHSRGAHMRIALFITCLTDTLFPETGKAMTALLERLGHEVVFPPGQACCGPMPFNSGYRRETVPMVRGFARAFGGFDTIVTPSASCAAMVREYHPAVAAE